MTKVKNLVVGDVHQDSSALFNLAKFVGKPYDRIIQVGDFGFFPQGRRDVIEERTDAMLNLSFRLGVPLLWIDGNHEDHEALFSLREDVDPKWQGVALSNGYIPRGTKIGNMLLVGGAGSIVYDKLNRLVQIVLMARKHMSRLNESARTQQKVEALLVLNGCIENAKLMVREGELDLESFGWLAQLLTLCIKSVKALTINAAYDVMNYGSYLGICKKLEMSLVDVGVARSIPQYKDRALNPVLTAILGKLGCGVWHEMEELDEESLARALSYNPDEIDIVISHTCPSSFDMSSLGNDSVVYGGEYKHEPTRLRLEEIYQRYKPKRWLFGHWHNTADFKHEQCHVTLLNKVDGWNERRNPAVYAGQTYRIIESEE